MFYANNQLISSLCPAKFYLKNEVLSGSLEGKIGFKKKNEESQFSVCILEWRAPEESVLYQTKIVEQKKLCI